MFSRRLFLFLLKVTSTHTYINCNPKIFSHACDSVLRVHSERNEVFPPLQAKLLAGVHHDSDKTFGPEGQIRLAEKTCERISYFKFVGITE